MTDCSDYVWEGYSGCVGSGDSDDGEHEREGTPQAERVALPANLAAGSTSAAEDDKPGGHRKASKRSLSREDGADSKKRRAPPIVNSQQHRIGSTGGSSMQTAKPPRGATPANSRALQAKQGKHGARTAGGLTATVKNQPRGQVRAVPPSQATSNTTKKGCLNKFGWWNPGEWLCDRRRPACRLSWAK